MQNTLLLNATYEPIMVIDWRRAMTLLFLGKSEVLEEYGREVRSANHQMKIPAVMRLRERVRAIKPAVRFSRQNIYARDQYCCQYCGQKFKGAELTYDHVVPRSRGGHTSWTNIVSCCVPCNRKKANRTPEQAGMRLLNRPIKPATLPYQDSFGQANPPSVWQFYLWR